MARREALEGRTGAWARTGALARGLVGEVDPAFVLSEGLVFATFTLCGGLDPEYLNNYVTQGALQLRRSCLLTYGIACSFVRRLEGHQGHGDADVPRGHVEQGADEAGQPLSG